MQVTTANVANAHIIGFFCLLPVTALVEAWFEILVEIVYVTPGGVDPSVFLGPRRMSSSMLQVVLLPPEEVEARTFVME